MKTISFLTNSQIAVAQSRCRSADRLQKLIGSETASEFERMLAEIVVARRFRASLGLRHWPIVPEGMPPRSPTSRAKAALLSLMMMKSDKTRLSYLTHLMGG